MRAREHQLRPLCEVARHGAKLRVEFFPPDSDTEPRHAESIALSAAARLNNPPGSLERPDTWRQVKIDGLGTDFLVSPDSTAVPSTGPKVSSVKWERQALGRHAQGPLGRAGCTRRKLRCHLSKDAQVSRLACSRDSTLPGQTSDVCRRNDNNERTD